jgi:hypothetical protein
MKKTILTTIIALSVTILFAQYKRHFNYANIRPLNNINLNILGEASLFSVNYERLFLNTSNFFLAPGFGLGVYEELEGLFFSGGSAYVCIPHHITANLGIEKHFFEFGLGGTYINKNPNDKYLIYTIVGYRFQPLDSDEFYFRIYGNILISDIKATSIKFIPFGLSFGISF